MIAFASLFLGLVLGVVDVDMVAAQGIARVDLLLDGRAAATMGPPFRARLDLGAEVTPHELVAVARDGAGREVGRTRQWINLPRALAEAEFVLERGNGGEGRIARLTWRCATREVPIALSVSFDGRPLAVTDPSRIALPRHVPEQLHFLRAEFDFGGDVKAVADTLFGGTRKAETLTNLTALPILLSKGRRTPTTAELKGAVTAAGAPAAPVAVEEGPAEVVLVMAGRTNDDFVRIASGVPSRSAFRLGTDQSFRFVWCRPLVSRQSAQEIATFPMSPEVAPGNDTILHLGSILSAPSDGSRLEVGKAVATAGLSAAARDRRRAVVLVVGTEAKDEGELAPEKARAFLERLHVPLFVWSVGREPTPLAGRYGPVIDATTWPRFEEAVRALAEQLGRQRIVWVEGTWLPQALALREATPGMALAR